jgi:Holliday junction DNA helicase RuvB
MLSKVIGQERAKKMLELLAQTFERTKRMPPLLIIGPSGSGKTHLVHAWTEHTGTKLIYINGTAIKDALAFRAFFKEAMADSLSQYIVFIDECHMLPGKVQENLLSVLEHPAILCTVATKEVGNVKCVDGDRYIDKGDVIREALPPNLSFVLATTDPQRMKDTILNRTRKIQMEHYTIEHKAEIAMLHLMNNSKVPMEASLYMALANRARSIRHLRDELCETFIDISELVGSDAQESGQLDMLDSILGIDCDGATDQDIAYMEFIANNGIAGLATLAGVLQVDQKHIVENMEPFLLERGWVSITGKGRVLTQDGKKKLEASAR